MADIYIYDGNADDLDCMGLVGALSPVSCTHEENANGMSELEITHPYDEYGKWATLEIGRIVKAPVPVRTCPKPNDTFTPNDVAEKRRNCLNREPPSRSF